MGRGRPKSREQLIREFWARVDQSGGPDACWPYMGPRSEHGYGQFGGGRVFGTRIASRISVMLDGRDPTGLDVDHLCRFPPCVNPRHLEPVSHRENILRGETLQAVNAAKTHCPEGHVYDLFMKDGRRGCRTCRKRQLAEFYERHPSGKAS